MVSWWPPPHPDYNQITQAILYSMTGIPMLSQPQEKNDWKSVFSTFLIDLDRIFLFKRLEIFAINEPTKPLSQSIQVSQHLTIKDGLAECAQRLNNHNRQRMCFGKVAGEPGECGTWLGAGLPKDQTRKCSTLVPQPTCLFCYMCPRLRVVVVVTVVVVKKLVVVVAVVVD